VVQVGLVVQVVREEHRCLDGQGYLDRRGHRVVRVDQAGLVVLVDTVCTVAA
jgi:hypothetical protein